jgi:hypothetical protein
MSSTRSAQALTRLELLETIAIAPLMILTPLYLFMTYWTFHAVPTPTRAWKTLLRLPERVHPHGLGQICPFGGSCHGS